VRQRPERFQRLKFREFDDRASWGLRTILERLPVSELPVSELSHPAVGTQPPADIGVESASSERPGLDLGDVVQAIDRRIRGGEALGSPLAHYRLGTDGEVLMLTIVETEVSDDPVALPRWQERGVARITRVAENAYVITDID
jgi:hypothetical protein